MPWLDEQGSYRNRYNSVVLKLMLNAVQISSGLIETWNSAFFMRSNVSPSF